MGSPSDGSIDKGLMGEKTSIRGLMEEGRVARRGRRRGGRGKKRWVGAEKESWDIMFPKHLLFIFLWSTKWVRDETARDIDREERERAREREDQVAQLTQPS